MFFNIIKSDECVFFPLKYYYSYEESRWHSLGRRRRRKDLRAKNARYVLSSSKAAKNYFLHYATVQRLFTFTINLFFVKKNCVNVINYAK
jgi:hypothetical protein